LSSGKPEDAKAMRHSTIGQSAISELRMVSSGNTMMLKSPHIVNRLSIAFIGELSAFEAMQHIPKDSFPGMVLTRCRNPGHVRNSVEL